MQDRLKTDKHNLLMGRSSVLSEGHPVPKIMQQDFLKFIFKMFPTFITISVQIFLRIWNIALTRGTYQVKVLLMNVLRM